MNVNWRKHCCHGSEGSKHEAGFFARFISEPLVDEDNGGESTSKKIAPESAGL